MTYGLFGFQLPDSASIMRALKFLIGAAGFELQYLTGHSRKLAQSFPAAVLSAPPYGIETLK
ncbi:hypothetical protein BSQ40_19640 [Serratia fonticola]|nr:hypothetical protein BSQ40_19640 [Serratia fonticola]